MVGGQFSQDVTGGEWYETEIVSTAVIWIAVRFGLFGLFMLPSGWNRVIGLCWTFHSWLSPGQNVHLFSTFV